MAMTNQELHELITEANAALIVALVNHANELLDMADKYDAMITEQRELERISKAGRIEP